MLENFKMYIDSRRSSVHWKKQKDTEKTWKLKLYYIFEFWILNKTISQPNRNIEILHQYFLVHSFSICILCISCVNWSQSFWKKVSLPTTGVFFFSKLGLWESELNIFPINGRTSFKSSQGNILGFFAGKRSLFYSCKREIYHCYDCCSSFHNSSPCIYHFGSDCYTQISLLRMCYSF